MNWIKRLISTLKAKRFSTTKLRSRHSMRDYTYLKKALLEAPKFLKIQAAEYLALYSHQENFDFLLEEFKKQKDFKLKSYTYQSLLVLLQNDRITVSVKDELLLEKEVHLLSNIGTVKYKNPQKSKGTPINFRRMLKDHLQELEEKKKMNDVGF